MRYSLLLASALLSISASAQLQWVKSIGGTGADYATANAVDANGNVYTTGVFESTVDFDPGAGTFNMTSAGNADIFVSKTDVSGNFVWAVQMGGTNIDMSRDITVDANGNTYITGYFVGTADFDPGAGTVSFTSTSESIFIVKLDNTGSLVWARHMAPATAYNSVGNSIAVDANGNVYVGGHFEGTVDFDPGAGTSNKTSVGFYDAFISKLDASGNYVWAKFFDGPNGESISSLCLDANGYLFACGGMYGTTDFDPDTTVTNSLTSNGLWDMFVLNITPNGLFSWVKQIGSTSYDYAQAIAIQGNNIYITGYYVETVDFDPGAGTANLTGPVGAGQTFVLKLDVFGYYQWAQTVISTTSGSEGKSIGTDQNGNVFVVGIYIANASTNAGASNLTAEGSDDSFFAKLTTSGNFLWANHYGSSGNDWISDIAIATNGDAYTAGYYTFTGDLDPTTPVATFTSNGAHDVMMHRFGYCVLNGDVTYGTNSITAVGSASSYQWIDCTTSQPVPGATSQTFFPTVNGDYAVVLTAGICNYTSPCSNIMLGVENVMTTQFNAYPNPTNGSVTIQLEQYSADAQIEIFNSLGQLVISEKPQNTNAMIELPEENGIYLIRVTQNGVGYTTRIVKE